MVDFPRIVFDVDNVLVDTMGVFCRRASELLGFEVSREQIQSHKVVGSIPLSPRIIFRIQGEVWSDWKKLPPLENDLCKKIIAFKKIGFEIFVATCVPARLVPYVKKWISSTEIPLSKFFHCAELSKAQIQAEALVDDSPEEIRRFISSRRQGFLYLQPWNITSKIPKAIVVKSLDDVLKHYGVKEGGNGVYKDFRWSRKKG